jgi:hypothetical protein
MDIGLLSFKVFAMRIVFVLAWRIVTVDPNPFVCLGVCWCTG